MPLTDEDAALQAIATLDTLSEERKAAQASIYEILHGEDTNPFVDVHKLFGFYNVLYFRSLLLPRVEVSWSPRLTLCAGTCELSKDDDGNYRRIRIKLSEALLKFRPREDTIDTLLHEAIHAYFFLITSWRHARGDDGTGHGDGFQLLADAINSHGGYHITIFHTFHDEVDSYRTHVWQCDGPCRKQAPFFGLVKRSMNRAPGKSDTWWKKHEEECGGTYTKISEPELTKGQLKSLSAKARAGRQKNKIDGWVKAKEGVKISSGKSLPTNTPEESDMRGLEEVPRPSSNGGGSLKRRRNESNDGILSFLKKALVTCPVCDLPVVEGEINQHLDLLHPP
ncbi:hypothetical protein AOQ84DRAFT_320548 [Glonium stellatum]|uniref:SprT-like domain-containing protein n=1 Tax=Glonium stellatum TaxID=574774 RepID=A0A8E2EYM4_9PEZI|nr:hypothetical protein AOQ84DRAFT_320548 [Glonium stellatum]